jgi:hypothetical protein
MSKIVLGIVGEFSKQPSEEYPFYVDFWRWLGTNETLITAVITALVNPGQTDEADATSTVVDGAAQTQNGINGDGEAVTLSRAVQQIKAGESGSTYSLKFLATTSDGNTYEADVRMYVKEVK